MTEREEAVLYLQQLKKCLCEDWQKLLPKDSIAYMASKREERYYDVAIKALSVSEIEKKIDLISREEALVAIKNLYPDMPTINIFGSWNKWKEDNKQYLECERVISELPSVAPEEKQREWIPISERLPEIGQRVIVTYETFDEGLQVRETIYDKYGFLCGHGIAWQPLPEPYRVESEK